MPTPNNNPLSRIVQQRFAASNKNKAEDLSKLSLFQFIEKATVTAARARMAEHEFLERGRASLAAALRTGKVYPAGEVLAEMRERLSVKMRKLKKTSRAAR